MKKQKPQQRRVGWAVLDSGKPYIFHETRSNARAHAKKLIEAFTPTYSVARVEVRILDRE